MFEYQRRLLTGSSRLVHQLGSLPEAVRAGCFSHPHAYGDRRGTEIIAFTPYQFQGADQAGGADELVAGQQAQGVTHQDGGSAPGIRMTKTPQCYLECYQAEVGFSLAATSRKPYQINRIAEFAVLIRCGFQRGQQEGQLERTPTIFMVGTGLAVEKVVLTHLVQHGAIGQSEGQSCLVVLLQQAQASPHTRYGQIHALDDALPCIMVVGWQARDVPLSMGNPCLVTIHESGQL